MRYQVVCSEIRMVGHIWQPGVGPCATTVPVSSHDLESIGEWIRENVKLWLMAHSGDFQEVLDFEADFSVGDKDWLSPWADPESEFTWSNCMYPSEE